MKRVNYYHKQFTLNGNEKKTLENYLCDYFGVSGITELKTELDDNNKLIVEIQGVIEE